MNQIPSASDPSEGQTAPAPQPVRVAMPASAPYVTYAIIGITVAIYLLQLATPPLLGGDLPTALFLKSNELIRAGQLWRLLTPMLLHGSLAHIGFNMYALLSFGTGLERHFGHGRFLLMYLLGAFAGNVASFLFTPSDSLGASTAVFGLLAAEGVFLVQNRKLFADQFRSAIGNIIFIAVVNLFLIPRIANVDNWGHIGGLLGGLIFAWFGGPVYEIEGVYPAYRLEDQRSLGTVIAGAGIVVLIFGSLAMWGLVR